MPSELSTNLESMSGIATSVTGERHIPPSTRADGSLRKEIRVRPGYRPPEDVEIYKNRTAAAWKSNGKGSVPGAEWVAQGAQRTTPAKNIKKKEPPSNSVGGASNEKLGTPDNSPRIRALQEDILVDPEAEKEKEAKRLSKKLRQAKDLEQKKNKGDALLPEQFEKVIRINELIRQLNSLGFDAHGQKKT